MYGTIKSYIVHHIKSCHMKVSVIFGYFCMLLCALCSIMFIYFPATSSGTAFSTFALTVASGIVSIICMLYANRKYGAAVFS